jgi:hypothetical protein
LDVDTIPKLRARAASPGTVTGTASIRPLSSAKVDVLDVVEDALGQLRGRASGIRERGPGCH